LPTATVKKRKKKLKTTEERHDKSCATLIKDSQSRESRISDLPREHGHLFDKSVFEEMLFSKVGFLDVGGLCRALVAALAFSWSWK